MHKIYPFVLAFGLCAAFEVVPIQDGSESLTSSEEVELQVHGVPLVQIEPNSDFECKFYNPDKCDSSIGNCWNEMCQVGPANACFTIFTVSDNKTESGFQIQAQGCWNSEIESEFECDESACIAEQNFANKGAFFCCCKSPMCNEKFAVRSFVTQTENEVKTTYNGTLYRIDDVSLTYDDRFWAYNIPSMLKVGAAGELQPKYISNGYRTSIDVELKFPFVFFGIPYTSISITTGGFINVGTQISGRSGLIPSKFIAPLMGNFHTLTPESTVMYAQNENMIAVEWYKIRLMDQPEAGTFTFSVVLHNDGRIEFYYFEIPIDVNDISDSIHPVTAGISNRALNSPSVDETQSLRAKFQPIDLIQLGHKPKQQRIITLTLNEGCHSMTTGACDDCLNYGADKIETKCSWCSGTRNKIGTYCVDLEALEAMPADALAENCHASTNNIMDCPSDYFNPETTPDESIFDRENFENENSVSLGTIEDEVQVIRTIEFIHNGRLSYVTLEVIAMIALILIIIFATITYICVRINRQYEMRKALKFVNYHIPKLQKMNAEKPQLSELKAVENV